jgi:hypothetical protein
MRSVGAGIVTAAVALTLGGCLGEGSDQPAQHPASREEVTGTLTDGIATRAGPVAGKGTAGFLRTTRTAASGRYTLSLTQLTGPYLLANILSAGADPSQLVLTSVATHGGVVNITPLTTLLTAQVLGVAPVNAFSTFTTGGGVSPELITDAAIDTAQVDLTTLLKEILDLDPGNAGFIDTPFQAVAGDPMFDAIVALNVRLDAQGKTLAGFARDIANGAKACRTDLLRITVAGTQRKFCPVVRRTTVDPDDHGITEYVFRDVAEDLLALRARDTQVLAATLQLRDGSEYSCAATACAGIVPGAPLEDESRSLAFNGAVLASAQGNAVLTGAMHGAVPGVVLPPLSCAENLFYMVFEDRSVVGDCVSASDPFHLGGTFGSDVGPGRTRWSLTGDADVAAPRVEVVLDVSGAQASVSSVYYSDIDPDTFEPRNVYVCRSTACSGVTLGPVTINTTAAAGYTISVRNITFDHVPLSGYTTEGASTALTGDLTGSFTLLSTPSTLAWPPPGACGPGEDPVAAETGGAQFNLCIAQNLPDFGLWYRFVYDNQDETLQVFASNEAGDQQIQVLLDHGAVTEMNAWVGGAQFSCRADACAGISLSAPDGNGDRKLSLAGTVLRLQENFPLPSAMTMKLDVTNLVVPLYQ